MALDQLTASSLTSELSNLTEIFNDSQLPGTHNSRRTEGGFLVTGPRLQGFVPTPINSNRPRTSWVWKEGEPISKKDEDGVVNNYWLCRACFESKVVTPQRHWLKPAAPTSTPSKHLQKYHHFDEYGVKMLPRGQKRAHSDIRDLLDEQEQSNKRVFDHTGWQDAFTEWVAISGTSLRGATLPALKRLITFGHPRIEKLLPTSHNTVATWLNNSYARHQAKVVTCLVQPKIIPRINSCPQTSASVRNIDTKERSDIHRVLARPSRKRHIASSGANWLNRCRGTSHTTQSTASICWKKWTCET